MAENMNCHELSINYMAYSWQFVFNITLAFCLDSKETRPATEVEQTHSHVNTFSYHLYRAFEELAEGFAFQQAVGEEGQVGELVD